MKNQLYLMKKIVKSMPAICCSLLLAANPINVFASSENDLQGIVAGNNELAFDLYKQMTLNNNDTNVFYSPISISTALAMTYAGARGETEKQMAKTLHFTLDQQHLHPAYFELMKSLKNQKEYELHIANALWGQTGYKFLNDFVSLTNNYYEAGFKEVNFKNNTEGSRREINHWVEEQTKEKIKELIPEKILKPSTRLVLTNAIYFKGSWAHKFDTKKTLEIPFKTTSGRKIQVPTMMTQNDLNYTENNMFQILELPYSGNKLSMVILLPKENQKLEQLEKILTANTIETWLGDLRKEKIDLFLPKFKIAYNLNLNDALKSLGMKDAFDETANFSGMTGYHDLYISRVLHKAFVDVNEEGTEAAAATAVIMEFKSMPSKSLIFKADHPFIFLIRDISTGNIVFIGRIMNPNIIE